MARVHSVSRLASIVVLGLAVSPAAGGSAAADGARKAGEITVEPASLTTAETGPVPFETGTLYVPENRHDPRSRLIGVGFARFRALQPSGAPPIFHLPGGPGLSTLSVLKPGAAGLAARLQLLAWYRRAGDVVIVDQRGFSERGDVLKFDRSLPPEPLDRPASLARATAAIVTAARAAVAETAAKGVDLRGYTVLEYADDVNDLRRALGYERISLVANSFGSQWSFAILRRHPDIVARALLSGIEPLDYGYDMPAHVLAAVQRMWWEAEQDARLTPYLPGGGLMGAAREIVHRLERAPVSVGVSDDKTRQTATVVLGPEDFQRDFFQVSKPADLLSIYHGRYEKWARAVLEARRAPRTEPNLIRPLIDTSLGVTPRREYLLRADPAMEFLGHWNFDADLATAAVWPTADVGDEFRTEVLSRIPVVFVQGDWDTSTPIENTMHIATFFPNSRVLTVARGWHGILGPIGRNVPDVMVALVEYLQTGNMENVPARTSMPRTTFDVPDFPPRPSSASR